jgi:hypothetical protein
MAEEDNSFGDYVLIETDSWFGRRARKYTGQYNHCAIRISQHEAEAPDFIEWIFRKSLLEHNLKTPEEYIISYKIFKHKNITPEKREEMKKIYQFYKLVERGYDFPRILKIAKRHRNGMKPDMTNIATSKNAVIYQLSNAFVNGVAFALHSFGKNKSKDKSKGINELEKLALENPSIKDLIVNLTRIGMQICPEVHPLLYHSVGLDYGLNNIHFSQIEPQHILENPKFEFTGEEYSKPIVPKKVANRKA